VPSLSTLDPDFRPWAEAMFDFARSLDRRFTVTSARRSWAEQAHLWWSRQFDFAQFGMATGEKALPVAFPGTSAHEKGLAWDMARVGVDPFADDLLRTLGAVWKSVGGRWNISDPVHFQA
jgi:hypothetical protein